MNLLTALPVDLGNLLLYLLAKRQCFFGNFPFALFVSVPFGWLEELPCLFHRIYFCFKFGSRLSLGRVKGEGLQVERLPFHQPPTLIQEVLPRLGEGSHINMLLAMSDFPKVRS